VSKNLQSVPDRRISFDFWTLSLTALLAVGFILRVWRLDSMPPAVHPDEMAGLVGVLDQLSGRMPLHPFFDYRIIYLPLYGTFEYLSSLVFGYNAAAYRLPAVLLGLATIVCTIGLTYRLTKDRLSALLAGAVSAIMPWEITVSRVATENAAMLPFLLGGLWALRAGIEDNRGRLIALAGALLALDAYSYRAALPDAIVLAGALVLLDFQRARRCWRALIAGIVVFALVLAPLVAGVIADSDFFWRDRYISTFREGITPASLALFWSNYLAHFNLSAIFFYGDGNPRNGPPFGVLYLWMLPMMIVGAIAAFRSYGVRLVAFFTVWLALYPLGGAITNDGVPHFLRGLVGAPLAAILCGIGIAACWRIIRPFRYARIAAGLLLALALIGLAQFSHAYFDTYAVKAAEAFAYESRPLFLAIRANAGRVDRVCFEGLDDMNARTYFSYYLRDLHLDLRERIDASCMQPRSLLAIRYPLAVPPGAELIATADGFDGTLKYRLFITL
jgi:4-amino-4-deoxy-L-arabinose transferase-like glycosyltransferase